MVRSNMKIYNKIFIVIIIVGLAGLLLDIVTTAIGLNWGKFEVYPDTVKNFNAMGSTIVFLRELIPFGSSVLLVGSIKFAVIPKWKASPKAVTIHNWVLVAVLAVLTVITVTGHFYLGLGNAYREITLGSEVIKTMPKFAG